MVEAAPDHVIKYTAHARREGVDQWKPWRSQCPLPCPDQFSFKVHTGGVLRATYGRNLDRRYFWDDKCLRNSDIESLKVHLSEPFDHADHLFFDGTSACPWTVERGCQRGPEELGSHPRIQLTHCSDARITSAKMAYREQRSLAHVCLWRLPRDILPPGLCAISQAITLSRASWRCGTHCRLVADEGHVLVETLLCSVSGMVAQVVCDSCSSAPAEGQVSMATVSAFTAHFASYPPPFNVLSVSCVGHCCGVYTPQSSRELACRW